GIAEERLPVLGVEFLYLADILDDRPQLHAVSRHQACRLGKLLQAAQRIELVEQEQGRVFALASLRGSLKRQVDEETQEPPMFIQILRRQHEIDRRIALVQFAQAEVRRTQ